MSFVRTTVARVGRENQLYNSETGARVVAGCVVLNQDKSKVLLISSTGHKKKWVIPKGGVELDEPDYKDSATRETWEEAGVTGKIVKSLGVIDDLRPPKEWNTNKEEFMNSEILKHPPRSEFHFFEMIVEKEYDTFPESHKRQRRWVTYQEAIDELKSIKRLELVEAIERSSVARN